MACTAMSPHSLADNSLRRNAPAKPSRRMADSRRSGTASAQPRQRFRAVETRSLNVVDRQGSRWVRGRAVPPRRGVLPPDSRQACVMSSWAVGVRWPVVRC